MGFVGVVLGVKIIGVVEIWLNVEGLFDWMLVVGFNWRFVILFWDVIVLILGYIFFVEVVKEVIVVYFVIIIVVWSGKKLVFIFCVRCCVVVGLLIDCNICRFFLGVGRFIFEIIMINK